MVWVCVGNWEVEVCCYKNGICCFIVCSCVVYVNDVGVLGSNFSELFICRARDVFCWLGLIIKYICVIVVVVVD